MSKLKTPILLFDQDCQLCLRFKMTLEKMDVENRINFVPVGTEEVYHEYPEIDEALSKEVLHFIDENGVIHRGGDIAPALAHQFPAVSKISWLLETGMGKKISNYFYDKVNELRKSSLVERHCPDCHKKERL